MLKFFYDPDIDYLEVFFEKTANYGVDQDKNVTVFKAEKNDKLIGYGIYRPKKVIPSATFLEPKIKIAILCYVNRKLLGLTERELAAKMKLSYRTYQRIEEGEIAKIDDLLKIVKYVADIDFSKILKAS